VTTQQYSSVVFDFGGVLITPITNRITELADRHGTTMERLLYVLMGPRETSTADHPWHRAERGEIPVADFQRLVEPWAREVGIELTGDEFEIILDGVFDVHQPMLDRIRGLRSEGYTIGMLTNSFREFRAHIESKLPMELFDEVIDSSEVGARKPEPRVYEIATAQMGVPAERIVYVDDFLANVEGARAHGWTAIHMTGVDQALAELDALLGTT
jgi:epoxide hydrolase-like predicted phosphatase